MFKKAASRQKALVVNPKGPTPKVYLYDSVVWPWQSYEYVDLEPKTFVLSHAARSKDAQELALKVEVCLAIESFEDKVLEAVATLGAQKTFSLEDVSRHFTPNVHKALESAAAELHSDLILAQPDALRDRFALEASQLRWNGYFVEEFEVLESSLQS